MYTYFIITLAVVVLMSAASYFIGRRNSSGGAAEAKCRDLERELANRNDIINNLRSEGTTLRSERDIERTKRINLEEQLSALRLDSKEQLERHMASLKESYDRQLTHLQAEQQRQMAEIKEMNKQQVERQLELIREQMRTTSETVLKARQQELGERNIEQVSKIVDPLNQSLKLMREALDKSSNEHNETMTRLDATIQANMKNSRDLGETAERLTRALIGEVKVQGNFGELKLRQLLEDLGLKEGEQYSTQQSLKDKLGKSIKDDDDKNLIPDFVLHFPNKRDVIVDSKVNLKAYEAYINADVGDHGAEACEAKSRYCEEHIAAVRKQVDLLAKKDYSKYLNTDYAKLNFVIMYMHNEGALNLALMNDNGLWKYAYDKGVLILGPQTMYMNLRILELMWTQSRQISNQKKIFAAAEEMIKRVQMFAERFNDVEEGFKETDKAIKSLKITLADGGQSIITSAKKIIKLGAKEDGSHAKISALYVDDENEQMIGELAEESESNQQINVIPEDNDEAVEKKFRN